MSPLRHTRKNFRVLTLCVRHATLRVTKSHTHAHAKKFRVCVFTRFASRDTRARNTLRVRHELYRQKIFTQPGMLARIRKVHFRKLCKTCTLRKVRKWAKPRKVGSTCDFPYVLQRPQRPLRTQSWEIFDNFETAETDSFKIFTFELSKGSELSLRKVHTNFPRLGCSANFGQKGT